VEEAIRIIEQLQAENAALKQQIAELTEQLSTAEQKKAAPPVKPAVPKREPKARRKRDPQHNRGRKRQEPTRIEPHACDSCPDCGRTLTGGSVARTRQVIDLPPPQPVEVVEHRVIERYCVHCDAQKTPTLDLTGQVLGQSRIGVRVAALVAYLRTVLRLPIRRIQEYLATMHELDLSVGEITRLLHEVRTALEGELETLKAQARASPILYADETGWREDGQNGYIWAFSTPGDDAIRYYEYDHSRGGGVVKRILAGQFQGHLVSDFYGGYNIYPGQHQRCWVHLLRDLHDLRMRHALPAGTVVPDEPQAGEDAAVAVHRWGQAVRQLYDDAQTWLRQHPDVTQPEREAEYVRLTGQSHALGLQYAQVKGHPCKALCQRLLRHEDELFQFVLVDGLSADNNQAERSIRPLVVIRKISGGSRSEAGTKTRMALASLFETWLARGLNAFQECLRALGASAPNPA
jgi:transposase